MKPRFNLSLELHLVLSCIYVGLYKKLDNFLVDNSGLVIGRGLDIGFGLSVGAGKSENNEPIELASLGVVLPGVLTPLMAAESRFGSLGPVEGVPGLLEVAEPCERFLRRVGTIFKLKNNFQTILNRLAEPLGKNFENCKSRST